MSSGRGHLKQVLALARGEAGGRLSEADGSGIQGGRGRSRKDQSFQTHKKNKNRGKISSQNKGQSFLREGNRKPIAVISISIYLSIHTHPLMAV